MLWMPHHHRAMARTQKTFDRPVISCQPQAEKFQARTAAFKPEAEIAAMQQLSPSGGDSELPKGGRFRCEFRLAVNRPAMPVMCGLMAERRHQASEHRGGMGPGVSPEVSRYRRRRRRAGGIRRSLTNAPIVL